MFDAIQQQRRRNDQIDGMIGSGMPETYELYLLMQYVKKVVDTYELLYAFDDVDANNDGGGDDDAVVSASFGPPTTTDDGVHGTDDDDWVFR